MARNMDAELKGRPLEAFTFHDKGFVVSSGTAVTRARKGPDRVSGCHGAGADRGLFCRMIMRSLSATVPGRRLHL